MNFIKRALLSVERKKGKTLILLLVVFILGNIMTGAISVEKAIKNTKNGILKNSGLIATIEQDYEKINKFTEEELKNMKTITPEIVKKVGNSKYIKYFDYTTTFSLSSENLKRYENENGGIVPRPFKKEQGYSNYFSISGSGNKEIIDIKVNKISLKEGRTFTNEEIKTKKFVVLISDKLAKVNNLHIGSKIKLENIVLSSNVTPLYEDSMIYDPKIIGKEEYEFEVIGIFNVKRPTGKNENNYIYDEMENRLYTTNIVVESANKFVNDLYKKENPSYVESFSITPLYVIENPNDLDAFKSEAKKQIPDYYKVTDNASGFRKMSAPMENMEWLSSIILIVSIGGTIMILSLLITLFLKDRRHEIGIYLSLGEQKKKIISQIVIEVLLIAAVGITIAIFTGSMLSNSVSKKMLNNQLISDTKNDYTDPEDSSSLDYLGYKIEVPKEELIKSYKISISLELIMLFYIISLSTVLVSSVIPMIYITRLKPKKVLM